MKINLKRAYRLLMAAALAALTLSACSSPTPAPQSTEAPEENFTVTFNLNKETAVGQPSAQSVKKGDRAVEPDAPECDNAIFAEWCKDAEGFSPFSFDTSITADTTLYAAWSDAYTVRFEMNDAEAANTLQKQTVAVGEKLTVPEEPAREGYQFTGWYLEESCVNAYDFENAPTTSMTLYAGWIDPSASHCTVTFDYHNPDAENATAQVENGAAVTPPAVPTWDNHEFEGWFTDEAYTQQYDFSAAVTGDVVLHAKWMGLFEAEYTDLTGLKGVEMSANYDNVQLICPDYDSLGASNGYYVGRMYTGNTTLKFVFTADKADDNATLSLRVGSLFDYELTDKTYEIKINDQTVSYNAGKLTENMKFKDFEITAFSLLEGENTVELTTISRMPAPMGLVTHFCPLVDCIKVSTVSNLSWEPKLGNI